TSAARDPRFPDVPSIGERALPGYALTYWVGRFGPPGLPAEGRARHARAVAVIHTDPEVLRHFAGMGLVPVGSTPEQ
ncbi:tripartite tricarboxylate transporter substrate-binding protein, partial [Acinetobacter baumannii]